MLLVALALAAHVVLFLGLFWFLSRPWTYPTYKYVSLSELCIAWVVGLVLVVGSILILVVSAGRG